MDLRRIAIFMSTSGHSGNDRAMKNLIPALVRRGYRVDQIKVRKHGPNLPEPLMDGIRVIDSGVSTTYAALPALSGYLRRTRPAVLLADKDRVCRTALLARWLSGARDTRLVLSCGTTISIDLAHRGPVDRWMQRYSMGHFYRHAEQVITFSEAAAADLSAYTGLPRGRVRGVAQPVVPSSLFENAQPLPDHPWFRDPEVPVILAVGELSPRKDFATLIRAFAQLRASRVARLAIAGRGIELEALRSLAQNLGLAADVDFLGFRNDVYALMAHAAVFAMTSRWEGLGFVLIEALASGTPVVATDCPSGPAEILQAGRYGRLVPVGDDARLADALMATLAAPPSAARCREAARPYEIEAATDDYLAAFGLPAYVDETAS
ncbi:MAG: glycosyltransferase [Panacagrimonas sp.]